MSNSLQPRELQHVRLPCPSLSPGVCSNSCQLKWWCHPTISFSAVPFSSCLKFFPASTAFPMTLCIRWPKYWSFNFSSSPSINIQSWFPLGLTDFISLQSKGLSRVFSSTTVGKHEFFSTQPSLGPKSPIHSWLLEKPLFWLYGPLSAKWYLCFLMPVHTMI